MGIPGLTTFINNRSYRYLKYFELRDTYLVIDGNSVACQIYILYAKCNCAFGGDYDEYAKSISDFFDDLLKCNVTPIVLIDGGSEQKKMKTIITRTKEKIRTASSFSPISQQRMKFLPLHTLEVFKDVLREKNIRFVQCLFEADNAIAAMAKLLNCPVLSYDSDFYVYGTLYIPFDTLDSYIIKSSTGNGYMKRCKIYKVEYLLSSFKGLNQSVLPLAAVLLGNDYVKRGTFKNFFRYLTLRQVARKKYSHRQYCIEATFNWLSGYTLEKAVIGILCRLPKPMRQRVLNIIEININSYTNASTEFLVPLGFPKEYAARVAMHSINRTFKFDGDVNSLTYIEETHKGEGIETSQEEEEEEEENEVEILDAFKESEFTSDNALPNNLPVWFVDKFLMGKYSCYIINLFIRRLWIGPVQIENYYYPSSNIISLKIISVIFALLKSEMVGKGGPMKYMIRGHNMKLVHYELEPTNTIFSCQFPPLSNIGGIPLFIRKKILNNTLEIANEQCIDELLPEWMLYVACLNYWIKQHESDVSYKCYVYSILVCLLFNIIDLKIGRHRIMQNFKKKHGALIESIKEKRKTSNYKPHYTTNVTILEACNEINPDDCLIAAPFFISHFEMDQKLYSNPKKFNRSIVHAFAEFQICMRHSMSLNALLEYPYPEIKIANLFNGTLLYNLSNNFKTRYDIEGYINGVLQNSPSLWRVFRILLLKVKSLFELLLQNGINPQKKSRAKCRKTKSERNAQDSDAEYLSANESSCEPKFYDANNPFSFLDSAQ
ncbi:protein asteroid [Hylaeus volcanicus]|uniref:protein asteroid n=1 Tax=Hylaeus volcanicus TaxID=313075 RepID=UPI0023B7AF27|nr:protein asteroid [Hylaeus volcanicus]